MVLAYSITGERVTKRIAKRGDRLIDPDTKKTYAVTELVFDGSYAILEGVSDDSHILMSQEDLKTWEPEKKTDSASDQGSKS